MESHNSHTKDPVDTLSNGYDGHISPILKELRSTLNATGGFRNTFDLLIAGPQGILDKVTDAGNIEKYSGPDIKSQIGVATILLDSFIDEPDDKKRGEVFKLILGDPKIPDDSRSIHFPLLIAAIDSIKVTPRLVEESKIDYHHEDRAFGFGERDISSAKAMAVLGVIWKDITPEQRILILEDFINISIAQNITNDKTVETKINENRAITDVVHNGTGRQLIPLLEHQNIAFNEIEEAINNLANRQDKIPRGNRSTPTDLSISDFISKKFNESKALI